MKSVLKPKETAMRPSATRVCVVFIDGGFAMMLAIRLLCLMLKFAILFTPRNEIEECTRRTTGRSFAYCTCSVVGAWSCARLDGREIDSANDLMFTDAIAVSVSDNISCSIRRPRR
jgi:hypothetical protein